MFDVTAIKEAYRGLVGFEQNRDPGGQQTPQGLLTSDSGHKVNYQHPLLTANNIAAVGPLFDLFTYAAWDSETTYQQGAVVNNNGLFIALQQTTEPTTDAEHWAPYSPYGDWLQTVYDEVVVSTMSKWVATKAKVKTGATLLESKKLFDEGSIAPSPVAARDVVAGIELLLPRSNSLVARLDAVSLHFTTAQVITLGLYSSEKPGTPLTTVDLDYNTAGAVQWFPLPAAWEVYAGPRYYVAYDHGAITGQALNSFEDKAGRSVGMMTLNGLVIAKGFERGPAAGDPGSIAYEYANDWGLNVQLSLRCDYTKELTRQKLLFGDVIAKAVAVDLLRRMLHNPEQVADRAQANIDRQVLLYELNGEAEGRPSGLVYELHKAMKAVAFDRANIDDYCLLCKPTGVRLTSI
jgi:hypothetical protein